MSMVLLERLFGFAAAGPDPVADAVERLVDSDSPRLRLAAGYRETLRPAVETALDFARRFVAALPPGREASAAAWGSDPALRAWLDGHPLAETTWALLRMDYAERRVLGMALAGDAVQREVAQTTVDFSAHRLRVVGDDEPVRRAPIERGAFDQLGLLALARLGNAQDRRIELESERRDAGREVAFARVLVGESQSAGHAFAIVRVPRGEPQAPPTLAEAARGIVL